MLASLDPQKTRSLLWAIYLYSLASLAIAQTCYHLDGSKSNDSQDVPCNTNATGETGSHSACCNYVNSDACLLSGLCLNTAATQPSHVLWATGCTDPTFQDRSCPKFCTDARLNDTACCANNFTLGGRDIGIVIRQLQSSSTVSPTGTGTSSLSTSTPTGTGIGGAQATQTCAAQDSTPSGGIIAGLAVEGSLLLISLAVLGLMLAKNRSLRNQLRNSGYTPGPQQHPGNSQPALGGGYVTGTQAYGQVMPQQYFDAQHTGSTRPSDMAGGHPRPHDDPSKAAEIDGPVPAHEMAATRF
ncbi:putative Mid2 domain-containing protein [Seiridium unicorne]|uniref:Mid2 domain-containing protein n=1 Tax=Seiridium unicorne TaxID=138068 RepID=A0ABR2UNC2_9PEZI